MKHTDFNHSVVVWFDYNRPDDTDFYAFSKKLDELFMNYEDGYYDGHEIAMDNSDGSFYFYGKNAESLFKFIEPNLDRCDFLRGATALLRFGNMVDEVPELELKL